MGRGPETGTEPSGSLRRFWGAFFGLCLELRILPGNLFFLFFSFSAFWLVFRGWISDFHPLKVKLLAGISLDSPDVELCLFRVRWS